MAMTLAPEGPVQLPGTCVNCHGGDFSKKWIDAGFSIDYYGRVYFCGDCLEEIGSLLSDDPTAAQRRIELLERANASGVAAINFLDGLRSSILALDLVVDDDDSDPEEDDSESDDDDPEPAARTSEPAKSASK